MICLYSYYRLVFSLCQVFVKCHFDRQWFTMNTCSVPDEGYTRNGFCALTLISMFFISNYTSGNTSIIEETKNKVKSLLWYFFISNECFCIIMWNILFYVWIIPFSSAKVKLHLVYECQRSILWSVRILVTIYTIYSSRKCKYKVR